ncbi:MAG: hypothetical protein HRU17_12305 [Polyangiaceae bacterium]|nr:hypothetical protein [Polyangiaceae bacterium]
MGSDDKRTFSIPPQTGEIDDSWGDDEEESEDIFDRQTAVPDMPPENFDGPTIKKGSLSGSLRSPVIDTDIPDGSDSVFEPDTTRGITADIDRLDSAPPPPVARPGESLAPRLPPLGPPPTSDQDPMHAGPSSQQQPISVGPGFPMPRPDSKGGMKAIPKDLLPLTEAKSKPLMTFEPAPPVTPHATPPAVGGARRDSYGRMPSDPNMGTALGLVESQERDSAPPSDPPPSTNQHALPSEPPPPAQTGDTIQEVQDRYNVGDFTGALVIAEALLEANPDDSEASGFVDSCREVLTQMYAARLGALSQTVTISVPPNEIRWLSLDHRAGFLLSLVDGTSTVEEILDISGMTRLDALRIMFTLAQQNVVKLS